MWKERVLWEGVWEGRYMTLARERVCFLHWPCWTDPPQMSLDSSTLPYLVPPPPPPFSTPLVVVPTLSSTYQFVSPVLHRCLDVERKYPVRWYQFDCWWRPTLDPNSWSPRTHLDAPMQDSLRDDLPDHLLRVLASGVVRLGHCVFDCSSWRLDWCLGSFVRPVSVGHLIVVERGTSSRHIDIPATWQRINEKMGGGRRSQWGVYINGYAQKRGCKTGE